MRIEGINPENADERTQATLAAQTKQYGRPLNPYPVLARRPTIFRAVSGMWAGLGASGLIDKALVHVLNRRVAYLNGCEF